MKNATQKYYFQQLLRKYDYCLTPYGGVIRGDIFADLDDSAREDVIKNSEEESMSVDYYSKEGDEYGHTAMWFIYPRIIVVVRSLSDFSYKENPKDFVRKLCSIQFS